MHDFLSGELEISEACLQGLEWQFPELVRLRTIPGIGCILAPVLWSEIGDLNRFASASALVNYTGLVPSLHESGEVSIHGGITRQGPVWLRWALVVAANAAIRGRNTFARRYRCLRRRKPAGDDPWEGQTLEWATTSPPLRHNFEALPPIRSHAPLYDLRYGAQVGSAARSQAAGT